MREDYFNLKETAQAIGIGDTALANIIKKMPSFPVYRIGGRRVIPKKALYDWFADKGNQHFINNTFRISIDYEKIREDGERYALHVMHRGTAQHLIREEERNRMFKTHLEF